MNRLHFGAFWHRLRDVLDVTATVGMIGASGWLLWHLARPVTRTSGAAPVPREPVSLEGSELLGSETAPVVVLEFSDFQCPYCARFANGILPQVDTKYVRTGRVQVAFRQMPLEAIHPRAFRAAQAAACAGEQGHFWPLHDAIFRDASKLEDADLRAKASAVGVDGAAYDECMNARASDRVRADMALAQKLGIKGTPTLLVGRRVHGDAVKVAEVFPGSPDLPGLSASLDALLAKTGS